MRQALEIERDPAPVQHDRQQHHKAGDREEALAAWKAGEHGEQHQQERAQAARAEERDDPAVASAHPDEREDGQQNDGADHQRDGREEQCPEVGHLHAAPDERRSERHKGEQEEHLRRRLAIVEEAVAELDVQRGHGEAGGERGEESAPTHRLGGRVGGKGHAECVERLVVPPHADLPSHLVEQRDRDVSRARAEGRPQDEEPHDVAAKMRLSPDSPTPRASMLSTTMGRRMTSLMPLSSRSATREVGAWRVPHQRSQQDRIGGGESGAEDGRCGNRKPRSFQAARAISVAGSSVPGPRMASARRRRRRTSPTSIAIASLKSTSTSPSVAITLSVGDSRVRSTRPSPDGPSAAPTRRKIATCGRPVRSTAPERSDEIRITIPIRASAAVRDSCVIDGSMPRDWRAPPAAD